MFSQLVISELDNMGLPNGAILQQDAASAHYAADFLASFNNQFLLWTERFGLLGWPPQSPDLTTCDNLL
jgi:hypothetical protein